MKHLGRNIFIGIVVVVIVVLVLIRMSGNSLLTTAGLVMNTVRSSGNPAGTLTVETNPAAPAVSTDVAAATKPDDSIAPGDWPSYNRTLASSRYAPLADLNNQNVQNLKVICSYDTGLHESFETGPIVVQGALIFTSAKDTFSIDPDTCKENWHARDNYNVVAGLITNRGAAYLDGRLFRGTLDGRVLAYDFKTGKQLWVATIANPSTGEQVDAAPIAWNGLVFIGVAMGDVKGVKGRMYALDAATGHIAWETYLVPRQPGDPVRGPQGQTPVSAIDTWANRDAAGFPITGGGTWTSFSLDPATGHLYVPVGNPSPDFVPGVRAGTNLFTNSVVTLDAKTGNYIKHFQIAPSDWHDWDVSNTPALFTTRAGKQLMAMSPKDGNLYGYDMTADKLAYRMPVTRMVNADVPLNTEKETYFCPGAVGGGEWNGVAYHPETNLVFTGEDEWCTAVKLEADAKVKAAKDGSVWMGTDAVNPLDVMGTQDPHSKWAGWLYATDADSGQWHWRIKTNYPIVGGVSPTAGNVVFFGDMGGNFYAVDAVSGKKLFHKKLAGAIGGGVITYMANGAQRVAVAAGLTSPTWPTEIDTAKIVVLGLEKSATP
jgi:alcohol dehydrogenase (cytochrome c)